MTLPAINLASRGLDTIKILVKLMFLLSVLIKASLISYFMGYWIGFLYDEDELPIFQNFIYFFCLFSFKQDKSLSRILSFKLNIWPPSVCFQHTFHPIAPKRHIPKVDCSVSVLHCFHAGPCSRSSMCWATVGFICYNKTNYEFKLFSSIFVNK